MPHEKTRYFTQRQLDGLAKYPEAWDVPNGGWAIVYDPEDTRRMSTRSAKGRPEYAVSGISQRLVRYDPKLKIALWCVWESHMTVEDHSLAYRKMVKNSMKLLAKQQEDALAIQQFIKKLPPGITVEKLKSALHTA